MPNGHRNLTLSRAPVNVWERPGWRISLSTYDRERWMVAAGGALLALYGARRRGWLGAAIAAGGGALVTRALTGCHDLTRARAWSARAIGAHGPQDVVADASDASFPASDAPSWTPTAGATARGERSRTREARSWH